VYERRSVQKEIVAITPGSRALEKMIVPEIVKKFPPFVETSGL
jgi:hypothetical protein